MHLLPNHMAIKKIAIYILVVLQDNQNIVLMINFYLCINCFCKILHNGEPYHVYIIKITMKINYNKINLILHTVHSRDGSVELLLYLIVCKIKIYY